MILDPEQSMQDIARNDMTLDQCIKYLDSLHRSCQKSGIICIYDAGFQLCVPSMKIRGVLDWLETDVSGIRATEIKYSDYLQILWKLNIESREPLLSASDITRITHAHIQMIRRFFDLNSNKLVRLRPDGYKSDVIIERMPASVFMRCANTISVLKIKEIEDENKGNEEKSHQRKSREHRVKNPKKGSGHK